MLDMKLPQDAVIALCRALDDDVGRTGEQAVTISLPHRTAFDMQLLASPMAMFDHAISFMGQHRKSIDRLSALLALRAKEKLDARIDVLGSVVTWRPSLTELSATVVIDNPIDPIAFLRGTVRLGLLQRLLAEELHLRVGRASYLITDVMLPEIAPDVVRKQAALVPARIYRENDDDERLLNRVDTATVFLEDCAMFMKGKTIGLRSRWLRHVATPIVMAHRHILQTPNKGGALVAHAIAARCADVPWRTASTWYLKNRFGITEGEINEQAALEPFAR